MWKWWNDATFGLFFCSDADDTTKSRGVSGHTEEEESGDEEDAGSAVVPAQSTSLDQGELKVADHRHPRRWFTFYFHFIRFFRVCAKSLFDIFP